MSGATTSCIQAYLTFTKIDFYLNKNTAAGPVNLYCLKKKIYLPSQTNLKLSMKLSAAHVGLLLVGIAVTPILVDATFSCQYVYQVNPINIHDDLHE